MTPPGSARSFRTGRATTVSSVMSPATTPAIIALLDDMYGPIGVAKFRRDARVRLQEVGDQPRGHGLSKVHRRKQTQMPARRGLIFLQPLFGVFRQSQHCPSIGQKAVSGFGQTHPVGIAPKQCRASLLF